MFYLREICTNSLKQEDNLYIFGGKEGTCHKANNLLQKYYHFIVLCMSQENEKTLEREWSVSM